MERVELFEEIPKQQTYPELHPKMAERVLAELALRVAGVDTERGV